MREINLIDIYKLKESGQLTEKAIEWGILPKSGEIECKKENCSGKLVLRRDASMADGFRYGCNGKVLVQGKKALYCKYSQSVRKGTFFANSKLELWQVIGFVNMWVDKVQQKVISKQVEISEQTAVDWSSFCREVVFDGMIMKGEKLGGPGKKVQIDESKFGKRKYNRGHHVEGAWVFGMIEVESGRVAMEVIEDRKKDTLYDLIKKWVHPGTEINADCWAGYSEIKGDPDYTVLQVNHSLHFKDPLTDVHTNNIESTWRHAKASCPYSNRQKGFLGGYLARYMFIKAAKAAGVDKMLYFFKYAYALYNPNNDNNENIAFNERVGVGEEEEESDYSEDE